MFPPIKHGLVVDPLFNTASFYTHLGDRKKPTVLTNELVCNFCAPSHRLRQQSTNYNVNPRVDVR